MSKKYDPKKIVEEIEKNNDWNKFAEMQISVSSEKEKLGIEFYNQSISMLERKGIITCEFKKTKKNIAVQISGYSGTRTRIICLEGFMNEYFFTSTVHAIAYAEAYKKARISLEGGSPEIKIVEEKLLKIIPGD